MTGPAKALMFQGTGSNVGKSLIVAGLCRYLSRQGYKTAPFKPQNMSNNACATHDGGEIGRAQALQAQACGIPPSIDMNPVLLKPESEKGAQIILQGKRITSMKAHEYGAFKQNLMPAILESYHRLAKDNDFIIIEGAGSPAEVNLRQGDIANMGFATALNIPVILIGDIDRGGVIASVIGTHNLLEGDDLSMIKGFLINRFRGDQSLFTDGLSLIETKTNWPSFGIVPWFERAADFPSEDSVDLHQKYKKSNTSKDDLHIIVPVLSRIANFDDLDPLAKADGIRLSLIPAGKPLPADGDLILITGSKSSLQDCADFIENGWDIDLKAHHRRGGFVLGLCGGYQILGQWIEDKDGIEGAKDSRQKGLGLLDVTTRLNGEKITRQINGHCGFLQQDFTGYEIHNGRTIGEDCQRPFSVIWGRNEMRKNNNAISINEMREEDGAISINEMRNYDGAISKDGRIMGSYCHGLFQDDQFRSQMIAHFGGGHQQFEYQRTINQSLDALADHLAAHLDLQAMMAIARQASMSKK